MGNLPSQDSQPLARVLQKLLKARDVKVGLQTLTRFLDEMHDVAPWYLPTGRLTLPCWEKLGRDLTVAEAEGRASVFARPVWELIYACLKTEKRYGEGAELADARKALEHVRSENSREGSVAGAGEACGEEVEQTSESSDSEEEGEKGGEGATMGTPMSFATLRNDLRRVKEPSGAPRGRRVTEPSAPPWETPPEAIPCSAATQWQEMIQAPPFSAHPQPPSYVAPAQRRRYFLEQLWSREPGRVGSPLTPGINVGPYGVYPIQLAQGNGQNVWEPFEAKQLRELKSAVTTFGPTAPYTITVLENLSSSPLTPADWTQLAKACLTPGGYLDWQAWYAEFAAEQAKRNTSRGHGGWNKDMLTGEGRYVEDQTRFPGPVYEQIFQIGLRAWKQVSCSGAASLCLSKIVQGSTEPFVDFVARMQDASEKIFPDARTAEPLVKQLIFEQCTKDCRAAIAPHKNKDIPSWIRICREIGGPLSNSGVAALLAAAVQQRGPRAPTGERKPRGCFKCGDTGHLKRNCPKLGDQESRQGSREAHDLCRRCRKGTHKAEECRSVFDVDGNRICGRDPSESKNGRRGPSKLAGPRPEDYILQHGSPQSDPLQGQRGWTSVSPPDTY